MLVTVAVVGTVAAAVVGDVTVYPVRFCLKMNLGAGLKMKDSHLHVKTNINTTVHDSTIVKSTFYLNI